jgi:hypothetical protein
MHTLTQRHSGFEFLETASKNINSWPIWKKELAGLCCYSENQPSNPITVGKKSQDPPSHIKSEE